MRFSDTSLIEHARALYPLNRSISGKGTRTTLQYFERYFPELERITFKTGENVFDWQIPQEWNVNDAYLQHLESGRKYAEFSRLNLHLLGHSEPCDKELDLESLKPMIYTQADQEDVVPYVTSYYSKRWGFCMSQKEKDNLPDGKYHVFIDSSFEDGFLDMSHACISGKESSEIFFSSYVCHPSMLNNELSGPLVLSALIEYIKSNYPDPRMSYRFVLLPETIGSIAYLSRYGKQMKQNMICGFNLSCVGDERAYSYIQTPYADTLADRVMEAALYGKDNVKRYSFLDRGSDERQYCSPGFRLPLCTFCRSKFGDYPEYHTSADNFSVVTEEGLQGALDVLKTIVDAFEICDKPLITVNCEPQLGKRGLYPTISKKTSYKHAAADRMNLLTYCDGTNTIFDIAKIIDIDLKCVIKELALMMDQGLICKG